jgi:large subunit ribosomal protein L25
MSRLELSSKSRTDFRKSNTKQIRRGGGIPATVYGHGEESKAIEINLDELNALLKQRGGRLSLIDLKIDGEVDKAHPVMIKAIQRDALTKQAIHLDFQRLIMSETVNASVPVVLHGDAPGTKLGGILELITSSIEVKALPDKIPTHFDIDISKLEMGQSIHLDNMDLGEGVEAVAAGTEVIVVTVRAPHGHGMAAEEVAPVAAAEAAPAAATE